MCEPDFVLGSYLIILSIFNKKTSATIGNCLCFSDFSFVALCIMLIINQILPNNRLIGAIKVLFFAKIRPAYECVAVGKLSKSTIYLIFS